MASPAYVTMAPVRRRMALASPPQRIPPPMRQFLKFMFASMLGTLLVGFVLIFLFFGMLVALGSTFSTANKPTTVKEGSILHLELHQMIVDRGSKDDLMFDFGPFKGSTAIGLNQVLSSLEHAGADDNIKGILLDLTGLQAGHATVKEIRDKLVEFKKESGKPVIAYSDTYTQGSYYLATAADQVYLQPRGDLQYHGMRSEYMFYKGLFEKLDIDVQFIRGSNNKFKSFGEVFTEDHMSDANREQNRAILNGLWDEVQTAVAEARGLDKTRLNTIADDLLVRNADDALELGLVDGLKYRDELLAIIDGIEKDFTGKIAVERYDAASDDGKKLMEQYELKVTPSYVMAAPDGTKLWSLTGAIHKDMLRQQVQAKAQ